MSKLTTPLLIVLAIVAVVGFGGWRRTAGQISATATELTTVSNKLVEATTKLAEQGATTETLRVQLNLQRTDLAAASNQIVSANAQLEERGSRLQSLESAISSRDAQITSGTRSNAQLRASIGELQVQANALQVALETTRAQIAETGKKLETTTSVLNETEAHKAALLAKWNDPSVLRSQLKATTTPPATHPTAPENARLLLQPDGQVALVPPPQLAKKSPDFSEPPEDRPSPKIIITY